MKIEEVCSKVALVTTETIPKLIGHTHFFSEVTFFNVPKMKDLTGNFFEKMLFL